MSYVVAVSIHTLRTEAACSLRLHLQMIGHFNSRTHVGATVMVDKSCRKGQIFSHRSSVFPFISIRAPRTRMKCAKTRVAIITYFPGFQFPHPCLGAIFATETFLW